MSRTLWLWMTAALALVLTTGCVQIEQLVEIREDLSGQMTVRFDVDLEEMLGPFLAMGGAEMRQELGKSLTEQRTEVETSLAELEQSLPEGTRLLESDVRIDDLKLQVMARIGFDHVSRLSSVTGADGQLQTSGGVGLQAREVDGRLEITFEALEPPDDDALGQAAAEGEVDPAMEAMMQQMLGDSMKLTLRVKAPFEVARTNGTAAGDEVSWSYGLSELETLSERGEAPQPQVVFELRPAAEPAEVVVSEAPAALSGRAEMAFVQIDELYVARTEVTQLQWKKVLHDKPSDCDRGCGKTHPVQRVRFADAARFANALSALEGLRECYVVGDEVTWPEGERCPGYRLPTDEEWSRLAHRVDPQTGWFAGDSGGTTHPVGQRAASPLGLYDVAGNVAEWTWGGEGTDRTARGGSFAEAADAGDSRAYPAALGQANVGLRVVRGASAP